MKAHYYPETESIYIDIKDVPSVDSHEVAPGVVADFDASGDLVGLDIDRSLQRGELTPEALLRLLNERAASAGFSGEFARVLTEFRARLESLVTPAKP
ncbi:MAG TPA: DUF2283 domain-containing protein [Thermoanaerobaculia bacterium]|nr:DUF2283 domain-containing protein [Thermoanaerobaculia bacterium]